MFQDIYSIRSTEKQTIANPVFLMVYPEIEVIRIEYYNGRDGVNFRCNGAWDESQFGEDHWGNFSNWELPV
jgi:hypothetical protein